MVALRALVERLGPSGCTTVLVGPTGAGKDVVARAIHAASPRSGRPFIPINCGAIAAELIESELFGHERGAFTGAIGQHAGRFEQAHGGTLFLDEIAEMPLALQTRLLRVIEEAAVWRIGGTRPVPVDVRLIAASHQDLSMAVRAGRFRADLYYRLAVMTVPVPALADHVEDIGDLIAYFQVQTPRLAGVAFSPDALGVLAAHNWPGNVRELRNLVERAAVLHAGSMIDHRTVRSLIDSHVPCIAPVRLGPAIDDDAAIDLRAEVAALERNRICRALDAADGVVAEAARLLTLNRTTLIEKMRRHRVVARAA